MLLPAPLGPDDGHPGPGHRRQVDAPQHVVALAGTRSARARAATCSSTGSSAVVGAGSISWTPSTRDSEAEATWTSSIHASSVSTGPISCWA